jgi:NADH dehydrogenase
MRVTNLDQSGVWLGEEYVQAHTVLWAAGIKASELNHDLQSQQDSMGRVHVLPTLNLERFPSIFVVGDQAHVQHNQTQSVPPLAPAAIQQGIHAAYNLIALIKEEELTPFVYIDKGMMATIGRSSAIAQMGSIKLKGLMAWLAWCFVHILYLIGFRSKLLVLIQWMWSYIYFRRGARLITHFSPNSSKQRRSKEEEAKN